MWSQKRLDTRIKFGGVWAYRPPEFNLLAKQVLQLCSHIPHLKILHQYIVFVKLKIYPILSGSDSSGSDIQGCIVSLTLLDVSTQHAHLLKWLGMMESNHHKQIQSLLHYHYANPQLLKMERVVRFELTTSSLENSYSTN